jgi:mannose-6-phosphate isomerase-like protein (cupin superfamily)
MYTICGGNFLVSRFFTLFLTLLVAAGLAADRKVNPTFLHRHIPNIAEKASDVTTPTCHYKPVFGMGDSEPGPLRGITRFGEITVDPNGSCQAVTYPAEEQVYYVTEGKGALNYAADKAPVRKNDFMYLPPTVSHALANESLQPLRVLVYGYRIPNWVKATVPEKLQIANIEEVKLQQVGGHPPSSLFQLLMGDTTSTRDRLASARILTSLFIMEFAPGGTNLPHHHDREEEIYVVLDGDGDMVAGGGVDGVENKRPAKAGDAYFFRLNCTVGFYSNPDQSLPKAHILAARSTYPFPPSRRQQ